MNIVLVDTPGFNDTNRSDTEILMSLVDWMQDCYQDRQLSGIIYLHDITQARMTGSSLTNLRMFRKLCGDENLKNVILATTKWAKPSKDVEVSREQELCTNKEFWGLMVKYGSKVRQFGNTTESACAIVEKILNMGEERFTPKIQQEVKQGKEIWDTDAGAFIDRALKEQARKHEEELKALVEEQNRALQKRKRAPKLLFKGKITVRADSYLDDQDMQAFLVEQQKVLDEKIKKREEEQRTLHLNHLTEVEEMLQKVKSLDRGKNSEYINKQKLFHLNHLHEMEVLKRKIMTLEKFGEEGKGEYINKQGAWRSSWKCLFCKRKNRSHGRWKCPDCNLQQNNITWEEAQKLKPSPAAIKTPPAI